MPTKTELRTELNELLDRKIDLVLEMKQSMAYDAELESLGLVRDDVLSIDVRDTGPQNAMRWGQNSKVIVGVWLKKRNYATKQKGVPSDYRRLSKPLHINPDRQETREIARERRQRDAEEKQAQKEAYT